MLDTSPTKVIQIGDNAHNRVAQACDRCRRKKIRCDGKRPCCTQCANVGFECVTSDKLSRRAFPRGYTESLEAKVRSLQSEVRQLRQTAEHSSNGSSIVATSESKDQSGGEEIGTWPLKSIPEISESSPLNNSGRSSLRGSLSVMPASPKVETKPYRYRGLSSIGGLVDVFMYQHKGKTRLDPGANSSTSCLAFHCSRKAPVATTDADWSTLSPETGEELIDKYFQEWNPLFPILDRADIETHREGTTAASKVRQHKERLALEHLVLSVGSLSEAQPAHRDSFTYEHLWRDTLSSMMGLDEPLTLQCLLLAQLFCIHKPDIAGLLHYQNSAIALVFRLALHLSQSNEPVSVAVGELRKRLFWTQYTIHCFSAACLGQSVLFDDGDIRCEYPSFAEVQNYGDDASQKDGINQFARNAPSLALFKLARTLSRILKENYSVFGGYSETRLMGISTVEELNLWLSDFKANFCHGGNLGNTTDGNILVLHASYHYVCTLLHRPTMICCGEIDQSSPSNFGESCKTLVQDLRHLEQNNMTFTMCIRGEDLLLVAGIGLLVRQSSQLVNRTSKSEFQALTSSVLEMVESKGSQRAAELSYLIELTKPRSSLKRSNSSLTQEDLDDEQMNGRNKIQKTQKVISTVTSFGTPEVTTPIKLEHAVSSYSMHNLDTKSPLKSTMRRISTVQSEPSYSPIRSSPVKRIPRKVRHDTTQSHDLGLHSNTCSSQPMQSWIRDPPLGVNSLRVDISAAEWAKAGNFVATPSDHSSIAMSASFSHNHDYSFYNNTYNNNPTSAPHTNNFSFHGNDDFTNADANVHPNSHIHVQHSNVNSTNSTNVEVPLLTPTEDYDPSWNTPSSVWDGSPAQSQIPVSTMTANCCSSVSGSHTGTEMNMNQCMTNLYNSHQVEQHPSHNSHPHHPHHHHALADVRDEYPQAGNYVSVPTVLPSGDVVAANHSYQQSMMMAAAAGGAYGHLHTPP